MPSRVFQSIDKREGTVIDYEAMRIAMPHFTDESRARQRGVVSTFILVETTPEKAKAFDKYWSSQKEISGSFYIFGRNCSSYASRAFRHAGIVLASIPGLDTPNNLYRQLLRSNLKSATYSGHIGFINSNGALAIEVQ